MGLPAPLPDILSLIETPHILFGQGGVVQIGVGMGCTRLAPVITDPKNDTVS